MRVDESREQGAPRERFVNVGRADAGAVKDLDEMPVFNDYGPVFDRRTGYRTYPTGSNDHALNVRWRVVRFSIRSCRTRYPIPGPVGGIIFPSVVTVISGSTMSSSQ